MSKSKFIYLLVLGMAGACRGSHEPAANDLTPLATRSPRSENTRPLTRDPALDEMPARPPGPASTPDAPPGVQRLETPALEILPGAGRVRGNVYTVDAWLGSSLDQGQVHGTNHSVVPNPIKELER